MTCLFKPELLGAMKETRHELENATILSPDDIEIVMLRRTLRQRIDELEKGSDGDDGSLIEFTVPRPEQLAEFL